MSSSTISNTYLETQCLSSMVFKYKFEFKFKLLNNFLNKSASKFHLFFLFLPFEIFLTLKALDILYESDNL